MVYDTWVSFILNVNKTLQVWGMWRHLVSRVRSTQTHPVPSPVTRKIWDKCYSYGWLWCEVSHLWHSCDAVRDRAWQRWHIFVIVNIPSLLTWALSYTKFRQATSQTIKHLRLQRHWMELRIQHSKLSKSQITCRAVNRTYAFDELKRQNTKWIDF